MKYILVILLLLCSVAHADTLNYYVDTGSDGDGDGTSTATSGENCAFASLFAAEAALDGIDFTGDDIVIHCNRTNGGGVDTTACVIAGWTVGTITITQDDFPTETGIFDEDAYYLGPTNGTALTLQEAYVTCSHLQLSMTITSNGIGINVDGTLGGGTTGIYITSCIVNATCSGSGIGYGIRDADGDVVVSNCTITGWKSGSDTGFMGVRQDCSVPHQMWIYNCTISDCYYGALETNNGVLRAYNCAVFNNDDDFNGLTVVSYCASDDGDATDGTAVDISPGGTESTDWAAAFTSYATGDFSVKDTDSVLYHAGDTATPSTDIIGTSWNDPASIGAFEFVASGGGTTNRPPSIIWISKDLQDWAPLWKNEPAFLPWYMSQPNPTFAGAMRDTSIDPILRQRAWQVVSKYSQLKGTL